MSIYHIQLFETRMTEDETDDVALFKIEREEDGEAWQVPVFLSPLFRVLWMKPTASIENRQEMVAGLGARAIAERLERGITPPFAEPLVLAIDYPGAPEDPKPLVPYDQVTIYVAGNGENVE